MKVRRRGRWAAVSAVAAAALLASACSSSSKSSSSATTNTTAATGNTATGNTASSGTTAAATGAPIKVMVEGAYANVSPNTGWNALPQVGAMAEQALKVQNQNGGINGHSIDYIVCNDQADPNVASGCARQAVAAGAVADIDPFPTSTGPNILPILQAAGIPEVGGRVETPIDFTNPDNYPIVAGAVAGFTAVAIDLRAEGCKKISTIEYSITSATIIRQFAQVALKKYGLTLGPPINIALNQADYSPAVATMVSDGIDCIMPLTTITDGIKILTAIGQSGKTIRVGGSNGQFTAQVIKELGPLAEGSLVYGDFLLPDTQSATMATVRQEADQAHTTLDLFSLEGWTAAELFIKVAQTIQGPITKASFVAALNQTSNLQLGTGPTLSFTQQNPAKGFNRIFNPNMYVYQIKGGKFVPYSNGAINVQPYFLAVANSGSS